MDTPPIYLASASPRRAALLEQIGVEFQVIAAEIGEDLLAGETPQETVLRLASSKAVAIVQQTFTAPRPVLGADTVVVVAGEVLGKPASPADAEAMLALLSGRIHQVFTGVALAWQGAVRTSLSISEVRFRSTTPAERQAYCQTGEPMDKAGGYAVQGRGAVFIERLEGSYSGVMGLPLFETAELLQGLRSPTGLRSN
jgi:septum formation protein